MLDLLVNLIRMTARVADQPHCLGRVLVTSLEMHLARLLGVTCREPRGHSRREKVEDVQEHEPAEERLNDAVQLLDVESQHKIAVVRVAQAKSGQRAKRFAV
jgi:hypothetical protein